MEKFIREVWSTRAIFKPGGLGKGGPVCVAVLLGAAFLIQWHRKPERKAEFEQRYFSIFLLLAYILLTTMSVVLFGIFDCDEFDTKGRTFLASDYSVTCNTAEHTGYKVYAVISMLSPLGGPVGFPLMAFALLWSFRGDIASPEGRTLQSQIRHRRKSEQLKPLSFLFDPFTPSNCYAVCLDCLRRIGLTGFLTCIPDVGLRCTTGILISVLAMSEKLASRPYHDSVTNSIAVSCDMGIFGVFLVASLLHSDGADPTSAWVSVALLAFVFIGAGLVSLVQVQESARLAKILPPPETKIEWAAHYNKKKFR